MAQPDLRTLATAEMHRVGRGYVPDAWETPPTLCKSGA